MSKPQPVRVFIGSGEASLLERKTLIHSLRKRTSRPLDLYVFNGTHNAIERNEDEPVLANLPLWIKYRNFTEFSNYRWLIPEICGYEGRAIFLDSDMVCLADIGELFDADMAGCAMLAKAEAYKGGSAWGMSNVLFDCSQCRFPLEEIFREIDAGLYSNTDFHQMTPTFLEHRPYRLGPLDPAWNSFDRFEQGTRLIHYTNLRTQPWKFPGHVHEEIWFRAFEEARTAGLISAQDVDKTLSRGYARQDILDPRRGTAAGFGTGRGRRSFKQFRRSVLHALGLRKHAA
jgi:hypothetical protein